METVKKYIKTINKGLQTGVVWVFWIGVVSSGYYTCVESESIMSMPQGLIYNFGAHLQTAGYFLLNIGQFFTDFY